MADIFDVLADGTRRELLRRLERHAGEVSVSELVTELGISQPTVSKHLKVLRDAGLVTVREKGQHRYYRLEPDGLAGVGAWIGPFLPAAAGVADEAVTPDGRKPEAAPGNGSGAGTVTGNGSSAAPVPGARLAAGLGRLAADVAFRVRRS
jgi:ArsR family transcriptional regulator, arsenate/arsenite/antimonite-responsive transcriptional repressor